MQSATLSTVAQAELDRLLRSAVEEGELPHVVAMVANRDDLLYSGAFGAPITDIYRIASMTKPVTSVAVMMLAERGLLNLDDPLEKYLPQYAGREVIRDFNAADGSYTTRAASGPITLRHLLTHTAGFGYDFSNEIVNVLCQDGKRASTDLPLFDPGSRWLYGRSTAILGDVITQVSGAPFYEFFDTEIFAPLGMTETTFFIKPKELPRLAPLTFRKDQSWINDPNPGPHKAFAAGDGGLLGTAEEYVRFMQMLLKEGQAGKSRLLSAESVRQMTSNQIGAVPVEGISPNNLRVTLPFPKGAGVDTFGLGFQIKVGNQNNMRSAGSYSWFGLFNTHFWVDPHKGIAALLFTQILPCYDTQFMRLLADFEQCVYKNLA